MHSFLRFGAIQWRAHGFTIRIIPRHVLIDFTSLSYIHLDPRRNCNFHTYLVQLFNILDVITNEV